MELRDRVAVVTGGASGIGRAMALAFAEQGARGVVVADLDGEGAERVAGEIGANGMGMRCDVTNDAQVGAVIDGARERFGEIDLFCANAGIGLGLGLEAPVEQWDRVWEVNTRSHLLAARRLVPAWLERGEGYFLATASAAGLVTQIGDGSYAVSKHAAVAFAEWLAVTYGGRGV